MFSKFFEVFIYIVMTLLYFTNQILQLWLQISIIYFLFLFKATKLLKEEILHISHELLYFLLQVSIELYFLIYLPIINY